MFANAWILRLNSLAYRALGRDRFAAFVGNFSSNIGPKLLEDNGHCVIPNLAAPDAGGIRQSLIGVRVIAIGGNTSSDGAAKYL